MSSTSLFTTATQSLHTTDYRIPPPKKLSGVILKCKSISQLLSIHAAVYRHDLHDDLLLNFHLLRAYSSLNRIHYSISLFNQIDNKNVFVYTAIINCHAQDGYYGKALQYYSQMLIDNIEPNAFTFSCLLKSCPLNQGKALHSHTVKFGLDKDLYVSTSLVDLYARGGDILSAKKLFVRMPQRSLVSLTTMMTCYAKHGEVSSARVLFDEIEEKDVVCWNVMIDGYAQLGLANEAMVLFRRMLAENVRPDEVTVVAVLSACGQIGALESGRWVHSYIQNCENIRVNIQVGTALIDMYSKCGSLEDARLVFDRLNNKDVVAWNSMIVGYAMHGFGRDALRLFNEMCRIKLKPSDITFIGVLSACAHAGMINEGRKLFSWMKDLYGIEPKVEHYGCMVNVLSRAGKIEEAYNLTMNMKIEPDSVLWGTLLGACRLHGDTALGEKIVEYLVSQNLANPGTYILLSNLYAAVDNWEGVARVRTLMKHHRVQKEPGCSSIEVNNKVHEFLAGDSRHPQNKEIYTMLEEIHGWLKAQGYIPQTRILLHDTVFVNGERSCEDYW